MPINIDGYSDQVKFKSLLAITIVPVLLIATYGWIAYLCFVIGDNPIAAFFVGGLMGNSLALAIIVIAAVGFALAVIDARRTVTIPRVRRKGLWFAWIVAIVMATVWAHSLAKAAAKT